MQYNVALDYSPNPGQDLNSSPSWCAAVFRLGKPVSYSRKDKKSIPGDVIDGALLRKEKPLIIVDDILQMNVSGNKTSVTKNLSLVLKGEQNYLSADAMLTGDWIMAWMHTNPQDTQRIAKALKDGQPANDWHSGFKFVGRISSVRRPRHTNANGTKTVQYSVQAIGFEELSTVFFYDPALATFQFKDDIWKFMSEIGFEAFNFISRAHREAGIIQDNAEEFFDKFIDIVVGEGTKSSVKNVGRDMNVVAKDSYGNTLYHSPQQQREAPYAYLVPLSVAVTLGRTTYEQNKGSNNGHRAFGYADLLHTVTGVQKYEAEDPLPAHKGFLPNIQFGGGGTEKANRLRCTERIKGTYIPIEPVFINTSLWGVLNMFKNPTINEMYTAIKPDLAGDLVPTIVFRQIPFSTNAVDEKPEMPLTKFLSLPRWKIPDALILHDEVGRSGATHFNFVHVYGQVSPYKQKNEHSIQAQMAMNAPIMNGIDIAVHGFRPYTATVAASPTDITRKDGARVWMEAIADWTFGSEHTLNGTINCKGIQAPIAEGDNVQVDGVVYHIEAVSHTCGIDGNGIKSFNTQLQLSNGMPADQGFQNDVAPRYPGFKAPDYSGDSVSQNKGDDNYDIEANPSITQERA
jgi:hypothetical protein